MTLKNDLAAVVTFREDPGQFAIVDNDNGTNSSICHEPEGVINGGIRCDRPDVAAFIS